jgi:hypothetical protein
VGRRDPDPRPPIEVWGADPGIESTDRVTVGHRAPLGARGRAAATCALVAAILLVGLALGDDRTTSQQQEEERDNSERAALKTTTTTRTRGSTTSRPSTTTSTTTATSLPTGPVFGEPVGAALLLTTGSSSRWTFLDLDTGARTDVTLDANDVFEAVPVRNGIVVVNQTQAELVPLPGVVSLGTDEGVMVAAPPTPLGEAERVLASGSPDSVWLVNTEFGPGERAVRAQLVDLEGNVLSGIVRAPVGYPAGATRDGLVFWAGGRLYLATEDGVRDVLVGDVLDVAGRFLAALICDDQAVCDFHVVNTETGRTTRLRDGPGARELEGAVVLSDTGAVALAGFESGAISLYDANGRSLGTVPDLQVQAVPVWLPGDLGLIVASPSGVRRISASGGGLVDEPIPALDGRRVDALHVIPR